MSQHNPDTKSKLSSGGASPRNSLLKRLRARLTWNKINGVNISTHPTTPFDDLVEEAEKEIVRLHSVMRAAQRDIICGDWPQAVKLLRAETENSRV